MAAFLGVTNTHGLTPAAGYANESSADSSVDIKTIRDETGTTKHAKAGKMITKTVSIKGKGLPDFAAVAAATITVGTLAVLKAKQTENGDDFPDFEMEGVIYSNRT